MANKPTIKDSEQSLLGSSFDPEFGVLSVELLSHNPVSDTLERVSNIQGNASNVYEYTSGNLTKITKTIGTKSYEKTFTYSGDDLTGSSAWSEV